MPAARVLIVSASAGSGHVRAGDALLQAFRAAGAAADHVDVLALAPGWVRTAYAGGFELIAARAPRVWRELYERSDGPDDDRARWGRVANRALFRAFRSLLRSGGFDACICTHFLPAQLAAGHPMMPPFASVVTDYTLHRYWVRPGVGQYFVATSGMADELRARLGGAAVTVTGIPVDPAFGSAPTRESARVALGLDPARPVALVMGGGFGMGIDRAAGAVLAARVPALQVVAVCGRNRQAEQRLSVLAEGGRLQARGFVMDMPRWMAAADLVVTKPGGLTTSEALAVTRPLLLTRGMPGHEAANARYLVQCEAALTASDDASITASVERFFDDAGLRQRLTAGARAASRPDAAAAIADAVLERLAQRMVG